MTRRGVGSPAKPGESTGSKGSRRREQGRCGERNDASLLEGGLPEVRARSTIFPPFVFGHRRAFPPAAQTSERGARRMFRAAHGPGGCFTLVSTPQMRFAGFSPPDNPPMRAFPPSPRRDAMASFLRKLSPVFPGTRHPSSFAAPRAMGSGSSSRKRPRRGLCGFPRGAIRRDTPPGPFAAVRRP